GKKAAADMAQGLAAVGIGVISGLARGIDTRAHEGALAKNGYTAAVLACSVDICYPPENWRLVDNILASGGALISEHFPKTAPLPPYFPARNRIISGLGDILLVIEAAKKSGTNHTVTHAINQGREVFALPGSIYSPASAGTNDMLKSGAHMLTHPNDAIYALYRQQKFAKFFQNTAPVTKLKEFYENDIEKTLAHDQKIVYANINHEGVAADFIARATEMEMGKLLQTLTALELGGHIKKLPGQKYALI
ncbi:MAG: DNA-protecting protein DprA, partial [Defluviitaleaceae bacterium]|nr:DNA-protecting protein DprA [Defluviitaleaceae bacterium]